MPRARRASATRRARFSSIAPRYVAPMTAGAQSQRSAAYRVGADEGGDHVPEPLTRVLLQEVPSPRDHRMIHPGGPGDGALQDGGHAAGDRVAVAEGDQK